VVAEPITRITHGEWSSVARTCFRRSRSSVLVLRSAPGVASSRASACTAGTTLTVSGIENRPKRLPRAQSCHDFFAFAMSLAASQRGTAGRFARSDARASALRGEEKHDMLPSTSVMSGSPTPAISNVWPFADPSREYLVDGIQRTILFWDVLRRRSNDYYEHKAMAVPHAPLRRRVGPRRPRA
jgi:hypothetical protein